MNYHNNHQDKTSQTQMKDKPAAQKMPLLDEKEIRRIEKKRAKEMHMVEDMIVLYCKKNHQHADGLCPDCARLAEYARQRAAKCPFMAKKTFCSQCPVHCYRQKEQEQIREVMRFSGWRMLGKHPVSALRHAWITIKAVRARKKAKQPAAAGPAIPS